MSDLDKRTVQILLRAVQSAEGFVRGSKALQLFCEDYRIGRIKGTRILLNTDDKTRIKLLLQADGIDPETDPAAWDGISRADALALGPNEKFTAAPVKRRRVAIKALPGRTLDLDGRQLLLPSASHLDMDGADAACLLAHDTVLLVENWECFEHIDQVDLDLSAAGANPLVVWRGDTSNTRANTATELLQALRRPVWAFVDYDPAGLLIAATLPHLAGIIAPPPDRLERDMARGLTDRYRQQLPTASAALEACTQPAIQRLWDVLRRHGRALPQEYYLIAGREQRAPPDR